MAELNFNSVSLNPYLLNILSTKYKAVLLLLVFAYIKMGNEEKESSWKISLLKEYNVSHNFLIVL